MKRKALFSLIMAITIQGETNEFALDTLPLVDCWEVIKQHKNNSRKVGDVVIHQSFSCERLKQ